MRPASTNVAYRRHLKSQLLLGYHRATVCQTLLIQTRDETTAWNEGGREVAIRRWTGFPTLVESHRQRSSQSTMMTVLCLPTTAGDRRQLPMAHRQHGTRISGEERTLQVPRPHIATPTPHIRIRITLRQRACRIRLRRHLLDLKLAAEADWIRHKLGRRESGRLRERQTRIKAGRSRRVEDPKGTWQSMESTSRLQSS